MVRQTEKMNNIKAVGLVFIALLSISGIFATEYATINQNSTLWSDIISGAAYYNAAGANITLFDPNGASIILNEPMTQKSVGVYYYVYNFTELNNWYAAVEFYNASETIALASASVSVIEEERGQIEMEQWIWLIILGLSIAGIGQYLKNWAVIISSGVWFLGLAGTAMVGLVALGFSLVLFFALFGILLILHGISNFYDQEEPNTVKLNND